MQDSETFLIIFHSFHFFFWLISNQFDSFFILTIPISFQSSILQSQFFFHHFNSNIFWMPSFQYLNTRAENYCLDFHLFRLHFVMVFVFWTFRALFWMCWALIGAARVFEFGRGNALKYWFDKALKGAHKLKHTHAQTVRKEKKDEGFLSFWMLKGIRTQTVIKVNMQMMS